MMTFKQFQALRKFVPNIDAAAPECGGTTEQPGYLYSGFIEDQGYEEGDNVVFISITNDGRFDCEMAGCWDTLLQAEWASYSYEREYEPTVAKQKPKGIR